jgi:hypothetical protein
MRHNVKHLLTWHAPNSRNAIIELQKYFIASPTSIDPEQIFYYARQSDIRRIFGRTVEFEISSKQSWPDEFEYIVDSRNMFWAKMRGVGRVVFVGEKALQQAGFIVPRLPQPKNRAHRHATPA